MSEKNVQDRVLKHSTQTRSMHWIHVIAFILLAVTGIGFYWKVGVINNLFGGGAYASIIHRWAGVVFVGAPAVYILLNFDRFARFIDTITTFGKDDLAWIKIIGGYVPFIKVKERPPQDKYNAGQKILGWLIIIGCVMIGVTGFCMWLGRYSLSPAFIDTCYRIHFWTAVFLVIVVAGHFFLAAIFPKSREEFSSMMIDGYVDAELSAQHNGKWFAQLKKEDQSLTERNIS
ncbi:formate dehydrogenase subunit gamma [Dehalobacter sp. TBBPA1]|uniref:formate dehydrogenase subunit gamma n=1 Tax=Dehalobacter sp. TBBPA1 TaxID=3235037 RepID=UPI0034A1BB7B